MFNYEWRVFNTFWQMPTETFIKDHQLIYIYISIFYSIIIYVVCVQLCLHFLKTRHSNIFTLDPVKRFPAVISDQLETKKTTRFCRGDPRNIHL